LRNLGRMFFFSTDSSRMGPMGAAGSTLIGLPLD
jgi:hypothetical protein